MQTLDFVERESLRRDLPPFKVGDTIAVHVRVREGDKERIQVFQGLVIRRRGGGIGETFTVRKISSGVGVERIFPVQSPLVTKIEIKARGYVRRSRLYYLRDLTGKKARLHSKVRDLSGLVSEEDAEALANAGNLEEAAPVVEEPVEAASETASEKKLRGKDRKKAKAAEKAKRMLKLKAEESERAARKAKQEAEAAAAAEAEQAAAAAETEAEAESGDADKG